MVKSDYRGGNNGTISFEEMQKLNDEIDAQVKEIGEATKKFYEGKGYHYYNGQSLHEVEKNIAKQEEKSTHYEAPHKPKMNTP